MKLVKLGGLAFWQDNNYNIWNTREYTEYQAVEMSRTLKNCYFNVDCNNMVNSVRNKYCYNCNNIADSSYCLNCKDSSFLIGCKGCKNCFGLYKSVDQENICGGEYCKHFDNGKGV
jgi:hypothetical protein